MLLTLLASKVSTLSFHHKIGNPGKSTNLRSVSLHLFILVEKYDFGSKSVNILYQTWKINSPEGRFKKEVPCSRCG